MRQVLVLNQSREGSRAIQARYCASFLCQLRGLTFRRSVPEGWGLLLVQGKDSRLDSAIHMLAMWVDLAVVWINSAGEVVDVRLARRWRLAYMPQRPARYVLELAASHLEDFQIGDRVRFDEIQ